MADYLKTLEKHAREQLKPAVNGQLSPAERIALYMSFLEAEEKNILERHRSGAGGLEIAGDRAKLIDTLLSSILEASIKARGKDGIASQIALVATGGYGRGLLNPRSDIDLLFLLPRASTKLPKPLQELVQDVLYLLWDVGFKVGHACRSIAECVEQSRADQENKTSLMDSRLIAGDRELFAKFQVRFAGDCIDKGQAAFFELRSQDLRTRHEKYSHTVFLQEPNVKEGCGGMRDYHSVQWMARVKRGSNRLEDLVESKLLTAAAFREMEEAYDFLHRAHAPAPGRGGHRLQLPAAQHPAQHRGLHAGLLPAHPPYLSARHLADGGLPDGTGFARGIRHPLVPHLPEKKP
ncbi:MAG: nucleotidyltransferase domain-containing protein [Akkermansiaceae bacterium]|nr:nucleotidyltransferase domain-containing protein [Akkermansiaceae bacterium]